MRRGWVIFDCFMLVFFAATAAVSYPGDSHGLLFTIPWWGFAIGAAYNLGRLTVARESA